MSTVEECKKLAAGVNYLALDFDFDRHCHVTLSNINIYVCLTCGIYLSGRSPGSPAHNHSLMAYASDSLDSNMRAVNFSSSKYESQNDDISEFQHRLYMQVPSPGVGGASANDLKVFVLPDNILLDESLLDDVNQCKFNEIRSTISCVISEDYLNLEGPFVRLADYTGREYTPGFIGICNSKLHEYANSVVNLLLHIPSFMHLLINRSGPLACGFAKDPKPDAPLANISLLAAFSDAGRRIWTDSNVIKAVFSPVRLMHALNVASGTHFSPNREVDPGTLLPWLINTLCSTSLRGQEIRASINGTIRVSEIVSRKNSTRPFIILPISLPGIPLYKHNDEETYTTVDLEHLLRSRYGSCNSRDPQPIADSRGTMLKYYIESLPEYLIIQYVGRGNGQNRTPVSYPLSGLSVGCVTSVQEYSLIGNLCVGEDLSAAENHLDERTTSNGNKHKGFDITNITNVSESSLDPSSLRQLSGTAQVGRLKGTYECRYWTQLVDTHSGRWFEIKNSHVSNILAPSILCTSSCVYLQVWRRQTQSALDSLTQSDHDTCP